MAPESADSVANLFADFDSGEMPDLMGTRRRELFHYRGLYFHLQDFDDDHGGTAIESAKTHPSFVRISADLKAFIEAYDRRPGGRRRTRWRTASITGQHRKSGNRGRMCHVG